MHDSMSDRTGWASYIGRTDKPKSGDCAVRALILAEVYGLVAEEWSAQVLWYNQLLGETKGCLSAVPFTVKWRFLICAS